MLANNNGTGQETTVTDAGVVVAIGDAGADRLLITEVGGAAVWCRTGISTMVGGDVDAGGDRPLANDTADTVVPIKYGHTHFGLRTATGTTALVRWIPVWEVK